MSRIRTLGVAVLALALATMVSSARAADDTKKKEHAGVHGVVTKIMKDADKDTGSFTVKVEEKKEKAAETKTLDAKVADTKGADDVKFTVNADTKFAKVSHKKKSDTADAKAEPESTPATFADLQEGDHVVVEAKDGVALNVKIHQGHKKKPV